MTHSLPTGQLPADGQIFLDHVGWMVPDIEAASAAFRRLGFPLTPYSVHHDRDSVTGEMKRVGSANRLAMLERGYLEILTPVADADTPVARHMRAAIARHPGVHLVAFTVADAGADASRLTEAGFALSPTVNLRRTIEGEDGQPVDVAFTVIRPILGSIPEGRMQVLTHHTPEPMWQSRYLPSENGIMSLAGVVFAVPDPAASAERLGLLTGQRSASEPGSSNGFRIDLDRGRLIFLSPEDCAAVTGEIPPPAPAIAAVELVSANPDATRAAFMAAEVDVRQASAGTLVVPAAAAAGCALIVRN